MAGLSDEDEQELAELARKIARRTGARPERVLAATRMQGASDEDATGVLEALLLILTYTTRTALTIYKATATNFSP